MTGGSVGQSYKRATRRILLAMEPFYILSVVVDTRNLQNCTELNTHIPIEK